MRSRPLVVAITVTEFSSTTNPGVHASAVEISVKDSHYQAEGRQYEYCYSAEWHILPVNKVVLGRC